MAVTGSINGVVFIRALLPTFLPYPPCPPNNRQPGIPEMPKPLDILTTAFASQQHALVALGTHAIRWMGGSPRYDHNELELLIHDSSDAAIISTLLSSSAWRLSGDVSDLHTSHLQIFRLSVVFAPPTACGCLPCGPRVSMVHVLMDYLSRSPTFSLQPGLNRGGNGP